MNLDHLTWFRNYLISIYQTPILENFLDLDIIDLAEGKAVYAAKIASRHSNIYGFAHGGTLAALADIAMGASCITLGKRIVTIDMNINFIKGAPTGSQLTVNGEVINSGNTIMRAAAEIFNDQNQLLVRSQASYFITGVFNEKDYPQPVLTEA